MLLPIKERKGNIVEIPESVLMLAESLSFCNLEGTVFFCNIPKPTNSSYKGRMLHRTITKIPAEQNRVYSNEDS